MKEYSCTSTICQIYFSIYVQQKSAAKRTKIYENIIDVRKAAEALKRNARPELRSQKYQHPASLPLVSNSFNIRATEKSGQTNENTY